jgi:hypothetical protein
MSRKKYYLKENWNENTLETLLNKKITLMSQGDNSYLIVTCNNLHKKVIKHFEIEDLRIMIGQNIGLKYLIPLAIEELKKNILAEGHFYEGDLLKSVLTSDEKFWSTETENWNIIVDLLEQNKHKIENFDTSDSIRTNIMTALIEFKKINN